MKKLFISLTLLTSSSLYAQTLKGDMDDDGKLTIADVTKLIEDYLNYEDSQPSGPNINGHEYVEVGGQKWATMNVGATTIAGSPATCYGDYYAWSEVFSRYYDITFNSDGTISFTWGGGLGSQKVYGYSYGTTPSYKGSTLDAIHDVATQEWGEDWRTPTRSDFERLFKACGGSTTFDIDIYLSGYPIGTTSTTAKGVYWCKDYDGVTGMLFCDGINKVFFPAAGYVSDFSSKYPGGSGSYWSASIYPSDTEKAYYLSFNFRSADPSAYLNSHLGFSVRPIAK